MEICSNYIPQRIYIPENKTVKFNSWDKTVPSVVDIYADFETLSRSVHTATPGFKSFTQDVRKLEVCSYSYAVISNHPDIKFDLEVYTGPDAVEKFIDSIFERGRKLKAQIKALQKDMEALTLNERKAYSEAKNCYLCNSFFLNDEEIALGYHGLNVKKHLKNLKDHLSPNHFPSRKQIETVETYLDSQTGEVEALNALEKLQNVKDLKDYLIENHLYFQNHKLIPDLKLIKVHDHDHITGLFSYFKMTVNII